MFDLCEEGCWWIGGRGDDLWMKVVGARGTYYFV